MQYYPCAAIMIVTLGLSVNVAMSETMDIESVNLNYVSEGTGQTVLFVHGAISDHRVWEPMRADVAREFQFVSYDQRYFGTGEWEDEGENFSRKTHTADLIALIEGLGTAPVDMITWSYSGEIGTMAALERPELFRSIVHYEPALNAILAELPGAAAANKDMNKNFGPAVKAVKEKRLEDAALRFLDVVFRLPEGSADAEPAPWPTIWRENGRTVPLFMGMEPGAAVSCTDLSTIKIPTLVVQGENTFTRYSMMSEAIAKCQPNAEIVTMKDVNHDGPYRKPVEFWELAESFIAKQ